MNFRLLPVACAFLLSAGHAWAQDSKQGWSNEAELALVTTSGNTETESYSGKQKTTYVQDLNSYVLSGRYLQTKTAGVETAKSWDASGRYERSVSTNWSAFLQYGAEADPYAGYIQRDNADIGGKYFIFKEDTLNLFTEAGYRSTNTQFAGAPAATPPVPGTVTRENFGRLYVEYAQQLNETLSVKYWVEYLPNFTSSNAYFVNTEPSATVMLSSIFSLKTAYLIKYRNEVIPGAQYADKTFTTSIVAKF
ncbi:MAG: DUF481 domain-containing protein [Bdellovibrionaceae bacterium]|nr:DUF481 domain-containing protein [Pseudobdellovibrionaceae bacterium]